MKITLPSLSKNPKSHEIQDFLNTIALYFCQKSQEKFNKSDQKENALEMTVDVTDDLITSLFEEIPSEALAQIGTYLISHPDAIATASTTAVGAPPNPITVGVLGLMILVMNSTTSSAMTTTASANLENFLKTNSKNS